MDNLSLLMAARDAIRAAGRDCDAGILARLERAIAAESRARLARQFPVD